MGKTVPLTGASLEFAERRFAQFYRDHPPAVPLRYAEREYAFAPFSGGGMRRHMAIPSPEAFRGMVLKDVPRHAYYSSAYYGDPAHPIMVSKRWEGADLIFDLDADHLQDAGGRSYPDQLALVKQKFLVLVEDYLFRDFGLSERDVTLAFSGGRGYHAHVHRSSFLGLSSAGRREIVEYLGGSGVDLRSYLYPTEKRELKGVSRPTSPTPAPAEEGGEAGEPERLRTKARLPKTTMNELPRLPPPDAPGWRGRFTRSFFQLLDGWERMTVAQATNDILERARRHGVLTMRPGEAFTVAKALLEEGKAAKVRENLVLDVGSKAKGGTKGVPVSFVELILAEGAVMLQGETDAPVTTDIHRLIRLPGSLHGGTGFRVLALRREDLAGFEPLTDAWLPDPEPRSPVRVELTTEVDYPLGGSRVAGKEGEALDLAMPQALFLVLRGEATVRASP